jgi:5'-nucleotidase
MAEGREPKKLRILVTNDDGIHAPGLKVLERIALSLSKDVWVVAPEYEQSGASHSLTLSDPLRVRQISKRRFAVRGTPTDCVMMAVHKLLENGPPDLVLSGVNRGSNLGEDVTYSGTVAAAMEGTLLRIPSIALSQQLTPGAPVKWATSEHHGPKVIARLIGAGWPADVLINVNFPDVLHDRVNGMVLCRQGRRDLSDLVIDARIDARGQPYYWLGFRRQKGKPKRDSDLAAVDAGAISVTPLQLDLTEERALKRLRAALT